MISKPDVASVRGKSRFGFFGVPESIVGVTCTDSVCRDSGFSLGILDLTCTDVKVAATCGF